MVSIRDYAKMNNVSYEAIRQQVKRYEDELNGHIIKQNRTQFLDDVAVDILDQHRKENPVVIINKDTDSRLKQLEGEEFNHVFTQKELKGTGYEGKDVKIVNGEVYVDGRSAGIAIYLLVQAKWVLIGLMTNGTIQALVDYGPDVKEAYDYAKEIWAIYQNRVKTVYANVAAKTATASLKDGNICVRQSPNHYVCGYSLRPEEDSD